MGDCPCDNKKPKGTTTYKKGLVINPPKPKDKCFEKKKSISNRTKKS